MAEPDIKRLPISEFRDRGYLHEVNRLLLHPLGLALEVSRTLASGKVITLTDRGVENLLRLLDAASEQGLIGESDRASLVDQLDRAPHYEEGDSFLKSVWDCQDNPEGVVYGDDLLQPEKAERVCQELLARRDERKKHTGGWVIQPLPESQVLSTTYTDPELRSQGGSVVEPGRFAGVELPEDEGG